MDCYHRRDGEGFNATSFGGGFLGSGDFFPFFFFFFFLSRVLFDGRTDGRTGLIGREGEKLFAVVGKGEVQMIILFFKLYF